MGKPMKEWLRFSVCYWHTFRYVCVRVHPVLCVGTCHGFTLVTLCLSPMS
jgi:hypothetical protein